MLFDYITLKLIWFGLIAILLSGFAIMGGSDMGVATLIPLLGKNDDERRTIINSIGPTWEGNQVWFILGGGALFAAWPVVYATAFSGLYFALLLVLLAMILRPPGIDYRSKIPSKRWRSFWDGSLLFSGAVPLLVFGIAIGNLYLGIPFYFDDTMRSFYTGSFFNLFHPFALLIGLTSLILLVTQGALFLQTKTVDFVQARARKLINITTFLFIGLFILAGLWIYYGQFEGYVITSIPDMNTGFSPIVKTVSREIGGWMANYIHYPVLWALPISTVGFVLIAWLLSHHHHAKKALVIHSLAIITCISTAACALFPFIMPSSHNPNHSLTVWDVSSSHLTLQLMFWATVILLPIVMTYTLWVIRVMRGPIKAEQLNMPESY